VLRVRVQREQTNRTRARAGCLENVFRTGDAVARQVPGDAGRAEIRRTFPIIHFGLAVDRVTNGF